MIDPRALKRIAAGVKRAEKLKNNLPIKKKNLSRDIANYVKITTDTHPHSWVLVFYDASGETPVWTEIESITGTDNLYSLNEIAGKTDMIVRAWCVGESWVFDDCGCPIPTDSPITISGDSETPEEEDDTEWTACEDGEGCTLTVDFRTVWDSPFLYAFSRDIEVSKDGRIISISGETRRVIDETEDCEAS